MVEQRLSQETDAGESETYGCQGITVRIDQW
jgi:hypothetical protein